MYLTKFATKLYATNVRFIRRASLLQVSKWYSILFQFNNGTIETSRFRQLLWLQYELLLPTLAWYYLHARSLLMSRRNIIFYLFSLTYLVRWAPNVRQRSLWRAPRCMVACRRRFHVNMGFSDDDRILAVTSNICCNIATGTCLIYTGWLFDIWILRLFVLRRSPLRRVT